MLAYLPLIQQLLTMNLGRKDKVSGVSLKLAGLAYLVMALCTAFVAIIFLLIALQSYLAIALDSPYAESLAWAVCGAVVAIGAATLALFANMAHKKNNGLVSLTMRHSEENAVTTISSEVYDQIKEHPLASVVLASLAGVIAGEKLH